MSDKKLSRPVYLDNHATTQTDLAFSSGSACSSALAKASYVLHAVGLTTDLVENSLRIELGRFTLQEEVNYAANRLIEEIRNIRKNRQVLSVNAAE